MNVAIEDDKLVISVYVTNKQYYFDKDCDLNHALVFVIVDQEANYVLDKSVVRMKTIADSVEPKMVELYLAVQNCPNWYHLEPLFRTDRKHTEVQKTRPSAIMRHAVRQYDTYKDQAVRNTGIVFTDDNQYTMQHRLFGSNEFSDTFVRQGKNSLTAEKQVAALTKYGKDVANLNVPPPLVACVHKGIKFLVDAMGLTKHLGTLPFTFRPQEVYDIESKPTSAGLFAGHDSKVKAIGGKIKFIICGTKKHKDIYTKQLVHDILEELNAGTSLSEVKKMIDQACKVEFKDEHYKKMPKSEEEAKKFEMKVRDYFIQTFPVYILSYVAQKDRQMFERGHVIKIGHSWWHGGAQHIAERVGAFDPDMVFDDADFDGLDTTLSRPLLDLYSASTLMYYDQDYEFDLLKKLVKLSGELLSVKHTNLTAGVWRTIVGAMPSGAFQTSHGDSWCVAVAWYTFVAFVISQNPHMAGEILEDLKNNKIGIVVYGDDAIYYYHRKYIKLLNIKIFSEFVARFLKMQMRDIRLDVPFFSQPNMTGECTPGIVFLKRNFIITPPKIRKRYPGIASVLPYRPTSSAEHKLVFGSSSSRFTNECEAISMVGAAYDTFGTNSVTFDLAETAFNALIVKYKIGDLSAIAMKFPKLSEKYTRKLAVTAEELWAGFPTLDSLLRRHIYEPTDYPQFRAYHYADLKAAGYFG